LRKYSFIVAGHRRWETVTGNAAEPAQPAQQGGKDGWAKRIVHPSLAAQTLGYLVVAIAGLIVLRATVDRLDFIGVGWLIALALIPLLPWALPRLAGFLQAMSQYVSRVDVGWLGIDLRDVIDDAIAVPTSGANVLPPDDLNALTTSTGINSVIAALRELRIQGGAPCAIIDLQNGSKWRLPNLYYLSVVLEVDPVVGMLFFTEIRCGIDGYFVRMSRPGEIRRHIEQAVPAYREALQLPASRDLSNIGTAQQLANAFIDFKDKLPKDSRNHDDPVYGFVGAKRLNELVVSPPGPVVESPGETLGGEPLPTVLTAAVRYVPTTTAGRLSGLIDRDAVALAVARAALARTAAK
jgi:hypothetical protein